MKKVVSLLLIVIMVFSLSIGVVAYYDVTMYAPDGRTIVIDNWDIYDYERVGWYRYPVQTLYAPGKSQVFKKTDVEAQLTVGWYTEPVIYMYSYDGRTIVVKQSEVEAHKAVGWYTEPFVTVYAADGRSGKVPESQLEAYKAVGWDDTMIYVYASDGRYKLVPKICVQIYRNVNWMTEGEYISYKADVIQKDMGYAQAVESLDKAIDELTDADEIAIVKNKRNSMKQAWRASIKWAPLAVLGYSISENSIGIPEVNIRFRNISSKTVTDLEVLFTCYDAYGNVTTDYPTLYNGKFRGYANRVWVEPDEIVTYRWTLYSNEKTAYISWPYLTKAASSDGTAWYR